MGAVLPVWPLWHGHHEFTVVGNFRILLSFRKIGGLFDLPIRIPLNPHKSIVIHEESMLIRWPLIPAPLWPPNPE